MRIEMREDKKVETHVIEVLEDVRIPQTDIILEKGDKVEIIPKEEERVN